MQSASWQPVLTVAPSVPVPPAAVERPVVEIEGDGLESQRPPRRSADEALDDPSEPFSPNYGSAPPIEITAEPA